STLTVSKIGSKLSKKNRLLGMHFFNPAQITKLVEIVKTNQTSVEAIQKAGMIVETIGKTPIMARDEPGFIANRLGLTLFMEASANSSRLVENSQRFIHALRAAKLIPLAVQPDSSRDRTAHRYHSSKQTQSPQRVKLRTPQRTRRGSRSVRQG